MENPLTEIVPVEEREEGVYIKVRRDANKNVVLKGILNALRSAQVINCDPKAVSDVVQRGRGAFEKIGPPFEYYDPALEKYIDVNIQPLKATVLVNSSCIADGNRPTENAILYCLQGRGVKHGIKRGAIKQLLAEAAYDTEITVAEGTPPIDGEDGGVDYQVEINPDKRPKVQADGSVDYRDIQTFTQVAQGQVIAKRRAATPGKPGMSVTGEEIPATPGQEYELKEGQNIAVSEDGKYLVVQKSGILFEEGGMLNIKEELVLAKDVDFSVGNVRFSGKITVRGSVLPGFKVESEEDIEIFGEVEAAEVRSRNGTVTVKQGIIGRGEATIFGKKGVCIGHARNAKLITEATLTVEKHCLHCECTCSRLEGLRPGTTIVGGHVRAYKSVEVTTVGNDKGVTTKISFVDKQRLALEEKAGELKELLGKIEKEVLPAKKQLASKAAIMKKAGAAITDRQKEELKKWVDQYNTLKGKYEYVEKRLKGIQDKLQGPRPTGGELKVAGDVFPGTELNFYGLTKLIKNRLTNKRFVCSDEGVEAEG